MGSSQCYVTPKNREHVAYRATQVAVKNRTIYLAPLLVKYTTLSQNTNSSHRNMRAIQVSKLFIIHTQISPQKKTRYDRKNNFAHFFCYLWVRHVRTLEQIQHPPQVATSQLEDRRLSALRYFYTIFYSKFSLALSGQYSRNEQHSGTAVTVTVLCSSSFITAK